MRLHRLTVRDPRSSDLKSTIVDLLNRQLVDLGQNGELVNEARLLPLRVKVKRSTWAIALQVSFKSSKGDSSELSIFAKQPLQEEFESERTRAETLWRNEVHLFEGVCLPFQFYEDQRLAISYLVDGSNLKNDLQKSLVMPSGGKNFREHCAQLNRCGKWLAEFHRTYQQPSPKHAAGEFSPQLKGLFHIAARPVIRHVSSKNLLQLIHTKLAGMHEQLSWCFVHGDFGPQNVLCCDGDLSVVDWGGFHQGQGLEDCIQFVTNLLTHSRFFIHNYDRVELLVNEFVAGFLGLDHFDIEYADLIMILAVSNIFKRQEWSAKQSSKLELMLSIPALQRLASRCYQRIEF